jgi:hypothetical protein
MPGRGRQIPNITSVGRETAARTIANIIARRADVTLGGLGIKDLVEAGRG